MQNLLGLCLKIFTPNFTNERNFVQKPLWTGEDEGVWIQVGDYIGMCLQTATGVQECWLEMHCKLYFLSPEGTRPPRGTCSLCEPVQCSRPPWWALVAVHRAGWETKGRWGGGEVLVRTNEGSKYRLMMLSPVSPHCDVTKVISLSPVHSFISLLLL
jgi:hypothetical protein